ncbi:HAD-IA family hydrolase [Nocardia sp. NPDC051463]|uniref:HAD family hydrolase n=1 Tax=Nocardia sp. NPDC051463 TaxID=3154845 RepID=UPI003422D9E5
MTVAAVLFDFSGTLFRLEDDESWADDLLGEDGQPFDAHETAEILRRMTAPVGQSVRFDVEGQIAWEQRDLDPMQHRKAYLEVLRQFGVPTVRQAERLYGRLVDPMAWTPYPDTEDVLKMLAAQRIPVGVVSNIAFDVRPTFAARGWDRLVDTFVLSFEVGSVKPDSRIFRAALEELGVPAESALMVGDSAEADGGATALGCGFARVDPLPTVERPDALLRVLEQYELG